MLRYIAYILALTLIVLIIGYTVSYFQPTIILYKHFVFLTALFFAVSAAFHYALLSTIFRKPKRFVQVFMILTVIKILVYISFLIIYIFTLHDEIKSFLFSFLILYVIYTVFEVSYLSQFIKKYRG